MTPEAGSIMTDSERLAAVLEEIEQLRLRCRSQLAAAVVDKREHSAPYDAAPADRARYAERVTLSRAFVSDLAELLTKHGGK